MRSRSASAVIHTALLITVLACAGCGSGVEGKYLGGDQGFFESMEFKSDGKVEITFMGSIREGTYVVEDDRVKVTAGGDTQIFTVRDDGCLAGGGLVGTYCKGG
jgi:hypothetical protein